MAVSAAAFPDISLIESTVLYGNNADVLPRFADGAFQMIYIDPPFNTGKEQRRTSYSMQRQSAGETAAGASATRKTAVAAASANGTSARTGFGGHSYIAEALSSAAYHDTFDDYLSFLAPRLEEAHRLLADSGTLYFHIDYREAHYCKIVLDQIFGREQFLNEIIWAYDYGAKSKKRWPAKHDTILVYVKDINSYYFNSDEVDREPYMAPGLVTAEKAARGKLPTDVWWHTIVPTNGSEKTGYPTQKPLGILRRMISASTRPDDWVLDFFAGSGTTGAAAQELGRKWVLIDENPAAIETMKARLAVDPVSCVR